MTVESLAGEYGEDLEFISAKLQLAESQNKVGMCSMCGPPFNGLCVLYMCVCIRVSLCLCSCLFVCVCVYIHVCVYICHGVLTYVGTYMLCIYKKNIYHVSVFFMSNSFPHILLYQNFCIFVSQPLEEIQGLVQSLCDKVGLVPS